ncbi:hypothetical protein BH11BAC6_BH11BAC6_17170 [soil metagenome]
MPNRLNHPHGFSIVLLDRHALLSIAKPSIVRKYRLTTKRNLLLFTAGYMAVVSAVIIVFF